MYRGRGGPRQATPTNVQCQKCLKRGHYSYECKESSSTRPYVSRPSRTQQLLNPKLVPKLTNDKPEELTRKKGVADEELAKKEAERAKQRALDKDSDVDDGPSRRRRSASFDSVSTVSTRKSFASPPPRRPSPSPPRQVLQDRAPQDGPRRRLGHSANAAVDYERSASPLSRSSPSPPRRQRSLSRDSLSPPRHQERRYRERSKERKESGRYPGRDRDSRDLSPSPGQVRGHQRNPRARSRSPINSGGRRDNGPQRQEPPRERSLSPFSKRLALTQSMNGGGR